MIRKTLFAITLFISSLVANAQSTAPSQDFDANTPAFKFEQEVIDYGKIQQNADGNREFVFTNTGTSPLIISNVKGSCGCTVPTKPEEPIMPGETGTIKVKYATNRIGRFSKTVTITSNASEPKKVVRIKGEVLKPEAAKK
ncbi:MAG: DUF1573 domain-containing protein [Flavicella sp.]